MSTTDSYKIRHDPNINEPAPYREARVIRELGRFIQENAEEIAPATAAKLHKTLSFRLIDIMDEIRAKP